MSTTAMQFAEIAKRWVPDHACIEFDTEDFKFWSATWSTPDWVCKVSVENGVFTLSVRWTEVQVKYAGLARMAAVMDLFVPLVERAEGGAA